MGESSRNPGTRDAAKRPDRRMILAAVVFSLVLPFISAFGLSLLYANIAGDITLGVLPDVLYYAIELLNGLCYYVSIGLLICAVCRFGAGGAKSIILIYAAYCAVPHAGLFFTSMAVYSNPDVGYYLSYSAVNFAVELLFGAAFVFIGLFFAGRIFAPGGMIRPRAPETGALLAAALLNLVYAAAWELYETISFFLTYDDPTPREIVSIITSYLIIALTAAAGYAVMYFTSKAVTCGTRESAAERQDT